MPTLNINGRRVKVDDSFLSLSPEQQNATVDEIVASLNQPEAPAPDQAVSMTLEQQKALALARARRRRHEAEGGIAPNGGGMVPWYQQAAQAADDTVRLLASGVTFGYADKLAGYLSGEGTEAERVKTEQARQRAGSAGNVAEFAGSVAAPIGLAGRGVTLAGRFGTGAITGAKGLAARSALMGAEGAGYGALTAAGNDQDIQTGALLGTVGGVGGNLAGEALSAGISKVAGVFNKKPTIPQLEDVQQAARDAYARAEQAGVAYTPQAVDRLNQSIVKSLTDIGYDPALQPGAAAVVRRLEELRGQNVTLSGLDTLRKVASNGFIPGNASNNKAISSIIEKIDDVIGNPSSGDVLMGNAQAGAEALSEARSLWSRVAKANKVQDAVNRAELRAASTGAGGNVENATRQNMRRLLEKPRGFTADERAALETIVRGTPTQNALRLAGKLAPTGVVSGVLSGGAGFGILGPIGLALPLAGAGAKAIADRATQKNVQRLADIILAGGSRAAATAPKNAVQRLTESKREAIARMLVSLGAFEAGTAAR